MPCHICGVTLGDNANSLSLHLYNSHKEISKEEYYTTYISKAPKCANIECNNTTKFINLQKGFHNCCSASCRTKHNQWSGIEGEKRKKYYLIELKICLVVIFT